MSFCVFEYASFFSFISVQHAFETRYGKEAPANRSIHGWCHQFKNTGCLRKKGQRPAKGLGRSNGEEGENPDGGQGPTISPTLSPNTREDLQLYGYLEYPNATNACAIHMQTSMPSPRSEPSLYDTAVSVANHYTGWMKYEVLMDPSTPTPPSLRSSSVIPGRCS
ncbi:hypothetical protein TNCV_512321 [Trichonephila clavipes]|nr:hypothetical protein TNCV_512321 [Trichonephila clavipes]